MSSQNGNNGNGNGSGNGSGNQSPNNQPPNNNQPPYVPPNYQNNNENKSSEDSAPNWYTVRPGNSRGAVETGYDHDTDIDSCFMLMGGYPNSPGFVYDHTYGSMDRCRIKRELGSYDPLSANQPYIQTSFIVSDIDDPEAINRQDWAVRTGNVLTPMYDHNYQEHRNLSIGGCASAAAASNMHFSSTGHTASGYFTWSPFDPANNDTRFPSTYDNGCVIDQRTTSSAWYIPPYASDRQGEGALTFYPRGYDPL